VIQLDNQALVINQVSKQKEILKGKFQLKISESLQKSHRIEKYAQEPVAYFLHKKRDFLQRLFKTKAMMEDREILEYQNLLKLIAGESKEGVERMNQIQKKKEQFTLKYGNREEKKKITGFFNKKSNRNS